ncbi:hypothetical protein [Erwinia sp. JUb26]|uniref:hypothetical protein n=1 Tax=Erwinia sp. JUb26 TaxID=2485126 RepID=UPI001F1F1BF0|nr:hypothetical protein [Erwinia sp. JUb26]
MSITLLAITLLLVLTATLLKLPPFGNKLLFSRDFTGSNLQLGYYDLLAHQREIYDTRFAVQEKTAIMTLTSPNDNRFIAKVSLEQKSVSGNTVSFNSHQIYYNDSGSTRMIKNILGYAQNNDVRFETLEFGDEQLLITPSGQIFNYH